jgi:hypothetical protein
VSQLALILLVKDPTRARVPRIVIAFPLERAVDIDFEFCRSELVRLVDDVMQDDCRAGLLADAFELIEEAEAS